jgi:hypothetical protein
LPLTKFFAVKNKSKRNERKLGNTDYMKLHAEMFAEVRIQNPSHPNWKPNFTKSSFSKIIRLE